MTAMERVCSFMKEAGTYYLATVDGDQPRVRPFGTIHIFEGKLYIQTGRGKDVAKQLAAKLIRNFAPCMILRTTIQKCCISKTPRRHSAPSPLLRRPWSFELKLYNGHKKRLPHE